MKAFIVQWSYAFIVLGAVFAITCIDYFLAKRNNADGLTNYSDRKRLRQMLLIGVALAFVAAFVQYMAPD